MAYGPQQYGGIGGSGFSLFGLNPGFTQANPYTQDWMSGLTNEQNMLKNLLFGGEGAGAAGYLTSLMDPMSNGGFMKNFLNTVPYLQGLTRGVSDAELAKAKELGQIGLEDAASGFAGMGSKYSGANLFAGNKAYQSSMNDLGSKLATENFNFLGSLLNNTLGQYAGAQQAGVGSLFSLFGLNNNNLAGAAAPMIMSNPSLLDQVLKVAGAISSFIPGSGGGELAASVAKGNQWASPVSKGQPWGNNPNYGGFTEGAPNFSLYPKTGFWPY
jgi:hypothetical protein